jgi:hypothetical protein
VADAIKNPSDPLAGHIPPFLMKHAGALTALRSGREHGLLIMAARSAGAGTR